MAPHAAWEPAHVALPYPRAPWRQAGGFVHLCIPSLWPTSVFAVTVSVLVASLPTDKTSLILPFPHLGGHLWTMVYGGKGAQQGGSPSVLAPWASCLTSSPHIPDCADTIFLHTPQDRIK